MTGDNWITGSKHCPIANFSITHLIQSHSTTLALKRWMLLWFYFLYITIVSRNTYNKHTHIMQYDLLWMGSCHLKHTQISLNNPPNFLIRLIKLCTVVHLWAGTAQSLQKLATAGRSGDRIQVGGEIIRTRPDRPWGPPSLLYNGY